MNVKEVTLLEGNSDCACVRLPVGRETTNSTRNLSTLEGTDSEALFEKNHATEKNALQFDQDEELSVD